MNTPFIRSLVFVVTGIFIVILPWWISVIVLLGLILYYPFYLEAVFFGFIFDLLYASPFSFPYIGLITASVLVLILSFVKTHIRR